MKILLAILISLGCVGCEKQNTYLQQVYIETNFHDEYNESVFEGYDMEELNVSEACKKTNRHAYKFSDGEESLTLYVDLDDNLIDSMQYRYGDLSCSMDDGTEEYFVNQASSTKKVNSKEEQIEILMNNN